MHATSVQLGAQQACGSAPRHGWAAHRRRRHRLGSGSCGNCSNIAALPAADASAHACQQQPVRAAATAAAAVRGPAGSPQQEPERQEGGEVLLDLLLPATPQEVCRALFGTSGSSSSCSSSSSSGSSQAGLLADYLQHSARCTALHAEGWQPAGGGAAQRRRLTYRTPLSRRQRLLLPLGPGEVANKDEQQMEPLPASSGGGGGGIAVRARCSSAGVPFADCFANHLQWLLLPVPAAAAAAEPAGSSSGGGSSDASSRLPGALRPCGSGAGTRVLLTARCCFHKPVLGPLRGQIESESMQGMRDVFAPFAPVLQQHFGGQGGSLPAVSNAASSSCMSAGASLLEDGTPSGTAAANGAAHARAAARAGSGSSSANGVHGSSSALQCSSSLNGSANNAGGCSSLNGSSRQDGSARLDSSSLRTHAPASGSSSSSSHGGSSAAAAGEDEDHDASQAWADARDLVSRHLTATTATGALKQAEGLWPAWSAACCRLQPGAGAGARAGAAPRPEEAAAVLQLVAHRAQPLPQHTRQAELAKSRVVRGLVEALRVSPPRGSAASGSGMVAYSARSAGAAASSSSSSSSSSAGGSGPRAAGAVAAALWSLAVLGGSVHYEGEAEALARLLPACRFPKLYQVSDTAWALATMRHHTPHLPLLEQQAAGLLQRQLAALAAAGEGSSSESEGEESSGGGRRQRPRRPSLSHFASLLWGLATLGHRPQALLALLPGVLGCQRPAADDGSGSSSGGGGGGGGGDAVRTFRLLCTLAWSLAVSGALQQPTAAAAAATSAVAAELADAAARLPAGGTDPRKAQLLQLHQFELALAAASQLEGQRGGSCSELCSADGASLAPPGSATAALCLLQHRQRPLLALAAAAWEFEGRRRSSKQVSAAQADVAATASGGLGLAVLEEWSVAGISVDIAVPSRQLAIEVDGPTHFCRNSASASASSEASGGGGAEERAAAAQPLPLGSTLLKRRLLQAQGWTVVGVNTAQWEQLRGAQQKRQFLASAVAAAEQAAQRG